MFDDDSAVSTRRFLYEPQRSLRIAQLDIEDHNFVAISSGTGTEPT